MAKRSKIILSSILLLVMIIIPVSALSVGDFDVKIVSYVYDYGKYIPRWSNVFKPGQTVQLYIGYDNPNSRVGAVALDYIIYVKDPNGYVVKKIECKVRKLGYYRHIYDVVKIPIDNNWIDGKYTVEIYAYDVLNYMAVLKSYVNYNPKSASGGGKIKTIDRSSAPYVVIDLNFYVNRKCDVLPPNRYILFDAQFESLVVPAGYRTKLGVTVFNNYGKSGTLKVGLKVDGKIVEEKTVTLDPYSYKRISFTVPSLPKGTHEISVVPFGPHSEILNTPPIYVDHLLFDKTLLVGKIYNGYIVYSPNDYVLGSVGLCSISKQEPSLNVFKKKEYVMNRDDAERILTNVFAFAYTHGFVNGGQITVALLKGSDSRAKYILPSLIDYVRSKSRGPITYVGVKGYDELEGVSVLIYVGTSIPDLNNLIYFFKRGGILLIDNSDYWTDLSGTINGHAYVYENWTGLRFSDELYKAYYWLYVNKVVTVTTEKRIPPKFVFSNLKVSKFLVNAGEPVTISFKVKNLGGPGKMKVKVSINGKTVFSKDIFLNANEVKELSFNYTPPKEGSYKVRIVGTELEQIFFAKATNSSTSSKVISTTTTRKITTKGRDAGLVVGSAIILATLIIIRILLRD